MKKDIDLQKQKRGCCPRPALEVAQGGCMGAATPLTLECSSGVRKPCEESP